MEAPAFSSSSNLSALTLAANRFLLPARRTGLTWEWLRGQSAGGPRCACAAPPAATQSYRGCAAAAPPSLVTCDGDRSVAAAVAVATAGRRATGRLPVPV